jgi:hypothetical protein
MIRLSHPRRMGMLDYGDRESEVRALFERLSNGRWKQKRDLTAYAEISHIPLWHIILVLCYSMARSTEHRMSTFGYAVPTILEHYFPSTENASSALPGIPMMRP